MIRRLCVRGVPAAVLGTLLALGFASCSGDAMTPPMMTDPCNGVPQTGRCLDTTTVGACVIGADMQARVVQNSCAVGYACVSDSTQAFCQLTASCREGQSRCASTTSREVCTKGAWQPMTCTGSTQCKALTGLGAACIPPGTAVVVQGTLRYERKLPNATLTGYTAPAATTAAGVFVELVDGQEVLGTAITDAQGVYSIGAYRLPTAAAQVVYVPISWNPDDSPAYAVAIAKDGDTVNSAQGLWSFTTSNLPAPSGGIINAGTQTIAAENSGAIHIFESMRSHLARATTLFSRAPMQSVVALWKPGIDMFCLACFINRAGGGTDISGGAVPLHFDNTIMFSGSTMSPLHWSLSVVNHELGHFVMNEYSKLPGEGGVHYVNMVEAPGLAFSEGYATWDGQAALSVGLATPNSRYFTVQQGTAFYVDIATATSPYGPIPQPNPNGPIDQQIAEIIVSAITWDLWRAAGDTPTFTSIGLPRVISGLNRGYTTIDLVDFADAVLCAQRATAQQVTASMTKFKFPWDNKPLCP